MSDTSMDDLGGFELLPPGTEAPEGDLALARQAAAPADATLTIGGEAPVPVGRSYGYDFAQASFMPSETVPLGISGVAVQRQLIEKVARTYRGAFAAPGPDFGIDLDEDVIDGSPFDAAAFAELEQACREGWGALPWVREVGDFDVQYEPGDDAAFVAVQITVGGTDGTDQVLTFDDITIPVP
jgi:hypothetical protein